MSDELEIARTTQFDKNIEDAIRDPASSGYKYLTEKYPEYMEQVRLHKIAQAKNTGNPEADLDAAAKRYKNDYALYETMGLIGLGGAVTSGAGYFVTRNMGRFARAGAVITGGLVGGAAGLIGAIWHGVNKSVKAEETIHKACEELDNQDRFIPHSADKLGDAMMEKELANPGSPFWPENIEAKFQNQLASQNAATMTGGVGR